MVYTPRNPPAALFEANPELALWLQDEFRDVARGVQDVPEVRFTVLHAPPAKPRPGQTVYADGSDWNPGDGEGLYTFVDDAWIKDNNNPPPTPTDLSNYMQKDANLSDVTDTEASRENIDAERLGFWPFNRIVDDNYVFQLSDRGKYISHYSGDDHNFTFPLYDDVPFEQGMWLRILNEGEGGIVTMDRTDVAITLIWDNLGTLNFGDFRLDQWKSCLAYVVDPDVWWVTSPTGILSP